MSSVVKASKIGDLPTANTITSTDLIIVEKVGTGTGNTVTSSITGTLFRQQMCRGPYTDDPTAATAGVNVGEMYYNSTGVVKVRLT